ncbi:MAG: alpha/beta fold hydrolase [Pseudomonadota bacterium]
MTSNAFGGGLNRRLFLGSGAGALALSLSGCATTDTNKNEPPGVFVLVHGAWHGGWCWRDVRKLLEAQGHKVYTPTLTGLGERAHLLSSEVSLQTHIKDVVGLIEAEELQGITLVGHSYGGMVITGVADALKDRIDNVVYLDAALPQNGDTMLSQGPERSESELAAIEESLRALAPDGVAMAVPPVTIFGIDASASDQIDWLERRLTPHPLRTWFDRIDLRSDVISAHSGLYIVCTGPAMQNTSFGFHAERLRSRSNWRVVELDTGHDAMVSAPQALTFLLLTVV